MKTPKLFKFFVATLALSFVGIMGAAVFGFIDLYSLFVGGTSVLAMSVAAASTSGTSTTETIAAESENLLDKTISQNITEMKPSRYPLDTIMRKIGMDVNAKSWDYNWYSVGQRDNEDTVAVTLAASGTTSNTSKVHELIVTNSKIFHKDDNILVPTVNGWDSKPLMLHVVEKYPTQDKLVVVAVNGTGTNKRDVPQIAATTAIVIIGNSKAETDAQTTPYQGYPTDTFNYMQIHMAQVEASVYEQLHKKEVNWGMHNYMAQALYDFRKKSELTSLFGVKAKIEDPVEGDTKYFSDGITRLITKGIEYDPTSIGNATWASWGKQIFTGNDGSEKRLLFTGADFMESMVGIPTVTKQIEAKQTEVKWGLSFKSIDCGGFGELLVAYHPLFDQAGWKARGLVLDVNYLERAVMKPMATREVDLKGSGQKNVDAKVIEEVFCTATRYPDVHAIIKPQ